MEAKEKSWEYSYQHCCLLEKKRSAQGVPSSWVKMGPASFHCIDQWTHKEKNLCLDLSVSKWIWTSHWPHLLLTLLSPSMKIASIMSQGWCLTAYFPCMKAKRKISLPRGFWCVVGCQSLLLTSISESYGQACLDFVRFSAKTTTLCTMCTLFLHTVTRIFL